MNKEIVQMLYQIKRNKYKGEISKELDLMLYEEACYEAKATVYTQEAYKNACY